MPASQPPAVNPKRTNARVGLVVLPASGRVGSPPTWPISKPSAVERRAWADLWATPHAVAWERLGWTRTVARYCRVMVAGEDGDKDAWAEARQLEDRLGLTPKAMRMLLWVVSDDEVGARREQPASSATRRRIRAVDAAG